MDIKELLKKYNLKIEVKNIETVEKWQGLRFGYNIEIHNAENKKKKKFKFYGSINDFKKNNKNLDITAFLDCITADAFYYNYSLIDFIKEFDYKETEAKNILKQSKETYKKLLDILENKNNIDNFRDEIDYYLNN